MHIRLATTADLAVILDLYQLLASPGEEKIPHDQAVKTFLSYPQEQTQVYVVEINGHIQATYTLIIHQNLAHQGHCHSLVENVALAKEAQGLGLGKAMMQHALDIASAAGCYKLALSSSLKRPEAHSFYEHLGFEIHGKSYVVPIFSKKWPSAQQGEL